MLICCYISIHPPCVLTDIARWPSGRRWCSPSTCLCRPRWGSDSRLCCGTAGCYFWGLPGMPETSLRSSLHTFCLSTAWDRCDCHQLKGGCPILKKLQAAARYISIVINLSNPDTGISLVNDCSKIMMWLRHTFADKVRKEKENPPLFVTSTPKWVTGPLVESSRAELIWIRNWLCCSSVTLTSDSGLSGIRGSLEKEKGGEYVIKTCTHIAQQAKHYFSIRPKYAE